MLLLIAKGHNKQQHYGSPPEVGGPAHPGSFCKQNSLPGLPSRPHCVSDSSVTLRVTRGASRSLRPPCARDRCAGGRRGFAPIELFCRQSPTAPLATKNSTAPPPSCRLDRGWRPRSPNALLGDHIQTRNAKWRSAKCCAAKGFLNAWHRSLGNGRRTKIGGAMQHSMGASHHHVVVGLLVGLHEDLLENTHISYAVGLDPDASDPPDRNPELPRKPWQRNTQSSLAPAVCREAGAKRDDDREGISSISGATLSCTHTRSAANQYNEAEREQLGMVDAI